jgi:hypothetical protein
MFALTKHISMKRRGHRQKPRLVPSLNKKEQQTVRRAKSKKRTRHEGLGTEIASLFCDIGLRPGEQIQEVQIQIEPVDFED